MAMTCIWFTVELNIFQENCLHDLCNKLVLNSIIIILLYTQYRLYYFKLELRYFSLIILISNNKQTHSSI